MSLLKTEQLNIYFSSGVKALAREGVHAVRDLSFSVKEGECLAVVGESGCGKSAMLSSLLALDKNATTHGRIFFRGKQINKLEEHEIRRIRGKEIAIIFQDPMSALNPTMTIGNQIAEALPKEKYSGKAEQNKRCVELLNEVQISEPQLRLKQFPFEFSGGMLQRIAIAIALAGEPSLILADEPTTSLDVTIQKQIMGLLKALQKAHGLSLILVSHDLALVSAYADRVVVMYAGQIIEEAGSRNIFEHPQHPYTKALLNAIPPFSKSAGDQSLKSFAGQPPDLSQALACCALYSRCEQAMKLCAREKPPVQESDGHKVNCWLYSPEYKSLKKGSE